MVELFGIRKPLDGRFAKDSFRPPLHSVPATPEPSSTALDLAGMLALFQAARAEWIA
jgi:hypothetical protein